MIRTAAFARRALRQTPARWYAGSELLTGFNAGEGDWVVKNVDGASPEQMKALAEAIKEEIRNEKAGRVFYTDVPYKNIEFQFGASRFLSKENEAAKDAFIQSLTTESYPYLFTGEEDRFPHKVFLSGGTVELMEVAVDCLNEGVEDLRDDPELLARAKAAAQRSVD